MRVAPRSSWSARSLLASLGVLALFQAGLDCGGAPPVAIVSPDANADVTSFSFQVAVDVDPARIVAGSLSATLNDAPLALAGGPTRYTATVDPGSPLADTNLLRVGVRLTSGVEAKLQRSFGYAPPKARLTRITSPSQLLGGPLAHGRVGDWLLENAEARFVIQDVGQRDLYSIGQFGGNVIDAELVGREQRDAFFEIQPSINVETVINAQTAEVVNDGQDGLPAVLRVCGPDDLIDFINPSSVVAQVAGASFPAAADDKDYEVEACTAYVLDPGKKALRFDTTLTNLDTVQRSFYVGDYINGMGELEQLTTSGFGIGELTTAPLGVLSLFGFGESEGVDYAYLALPFSGAAFGQSTFFTQSGVSFVLANHSVIAVLFLGSPAVFAVDAGQSRTYTRWFGVGDGSASNAIDLANEVQAVSRGTLSGCVTAGGGPAVGARVGVGPKNAADTTLTSLTTSFVTDANGCYEGTLPTGTYGAVAGKTGYPYEGSGTLPLLHTVTVSAGGTMTQDFALPATGRLRVTVGDESDAPVPARIGVVGFDPSPETTLLYSLGFGIPDSRTGLLYDVSADPIPYGLSRVEYAGADGISEFDLEPGTYQLVVSRGTEYSAFSTPITVTEGNQTSVAARIAQVVETPGFVSSDYHVHALNSPDSRISNNARALQFAGEGVDNVIMTDHEYRTDLKPVIAQLGLVPFVTSMIGEEITTFDYGHFNAYPLQIDPSRVSGGAVDFGGGALPGRDFPAYGSYTLSPAQIEAAATGSFATPDTVVQINHIDSHFGPMRIDTGLVPPRSLLTPAQKAALRLDPAIDNFFHAFPALELWNGYSRSHQNEFLVGRIGIWFNLLNQGIPTTMIGDTDTHELVNTRGGGSRSWTPTSAGSDLPATLLESEIGQAVKAGRAVSGQGLYVQARLLAADGSGAAADFTRDGSTLVASANGSVDLEIRVQAPLWAEYDRIEIYANATPNVAGTNGGTPVAYGPGTPAVTLDLGAGGFTANVVDVHPGVPGGSRRETTKVVSFSGLTQDTWFVVLVRGRDGVSRPMFPIMPASLATASNTTLAQLLDGNLGESGVMALGNTNALYADVDGTPGFQAPLAP